MRRSSVILLALVLVAFPTAAWAAPDDFAALREQGWLWAFLGVFAAGFLTSLTPCVYPMIPIVVGVFGARDESVTRAKALLLATCYVLGMGVMYSGLGVAVALSGRKFGALLANPWVVIPMVLFYAALAASMFGAYEINLPQSWQQKLNQVGGRGYGGAFGMGLVGGLTAAPCTGPILAGLLTFVATTGNALLGFSLLMVYAVGMGVLFWLIAAFALSLPKSGRWMESVKSVAGLALVVVGIYFLRPVVPIIARATHTSTGFLVAALVVAAAGVLLGAVHLSFHDRWAIRVRKGAGVALAVVGSVGVVNWMLTPKRSLPWVYEEACALSEAKASGKGVLVDFSADWCLPCKELEIKTFADPLVYADIESRFVPLKFDVSDDTEHDQAMQSKYQADTLPAVIMLDTEFKPSQRVDSMVDPDDFLDKLERVPVPIDPGAGAARGRYTVAVRAGQIELDFWFPFLPDMAPRVHIWSDSHDHKSVGQVDPDDRSRVSLPLADLVPGQAYTIEACGQRLPLEVSASPPPTPAS